MKRSKRTLYILPDLSARLDEAASHSGESPSAIAEVALNEYFARESVFGAVEAQTRRLGEIDDRVKAQNATLAKMADSINALGKLVVELKGLVEKPAPAPVVMAPAAPEPEPEPVRSGILGWRR